MREEAPTEVIRRACRHTSDFYLHYRVALARIGLNVKASTPSVLVGLRLVPNTITAPDAASGQALRGDRLAGEEIADTGWR